MPAMPAVPKVVRVDHHFTQGSDGNMQIRAFFQYSGTLSTTDATTWLSNIISGWNTNVMPILSNTLHLVSSELTDLTSNTSAQVQSSVGSTGGNVSAPNPAQVAAVLKMHIARRYRGGHPRVYIPGTSQNWLTTPTQWDATDLGTLAGDYSAYIAAAVAGTNPAAIGTITHVNVSFFSGFVNKTFPSGRTHAVATLRSAPVVDIITNITGNPVPGTQRRRE